MSISTGRILLLMAVTLAALVAITMIVVAGYGYDGPVSDHFDGSSFFNPEAGDHTFSDMLKWMWEMETVEWPEWVDDPRRPAPSKRVDTDSLRFTYIGHATTLIQLDGLNILTDPIWSNCAGPFGVFGPDRVRAPGIDFDSLPPIDYILISHDHWDHLDLPTLERIVSRDHPGIFCGLGVKSLLPDEASARAVELDWWESSTSSDRKMRFTFVPARHQSGRWPLVENTTLWGGFVIENRHGDQVYYAGDTGYGDFINDIHDRFGSIRLAILPIGNYEKRWFMKHQHMNPDDAVRAHRLLGATQSVGIHFATFVEHPEQAIDAHVRDLEAALQTYQVQPGEFRIPGFGEGCDVPLSPETATGEY